MENICCKKISIITVCLNAEETIRRTIESVISQDYKNIEYIIVDGMSTDSTMSIIDEYKDKIHCIIHEKDDGIYDAMNKGLNKATGDIVGFINSDDWYESEVFNHVKQIFDNRKIDIYSGRVLYIEANGERNLSPIPEPDELFYKTIPHQGTFVRKEVFEESKGFSTEYALAADYFFFLKSYCSKKKFYYDDYVIANYSLDGISSLRKKTYLEETLLISGIFSSFVRDLEHYELGIECVRQEYEKECENDWFFEKDDAFKNYLLNVLNEGCSISVWGTGYYGKRMALKLEKNEIEYSFWIDSNAQKVGKIIDGKPVSSRDKISKETFVIIAIKDNYQEIINYLNCNEVAWADIPKLRFGISNN